MNRYIQKVLDARFEDLKRARLNPDISEAPKTKSIISLALDAYLANNSEKNLLEQPRLDPHFSSFATSQIRLFLFAGHDTTSSSLIYTYHLLSKHPEALQKIREEHTAVFGPDPRAAAPQLRENPNLLGKVPYTYAVIRETLRLFPGASAMREGLPGVSITDRHGREYPTEGYHVWVVHQALHHNPRVWPRPAEFIPERWMVPPGHKLHPPPFAFRTFEHGPRNCIGQTLASMELQVALILTVRELMIRPAYEEFDAQRQRARNAGVGGFLRRLVGVRDEEIKTVRGERAYQIPNGGAHPADAYPCRVSFVKASL
jgi:hypothetical protein